MSTSQPDTREADGLFTTILQQNSSLAALYGVSADELEAVYAQAFDDITAERYDAALEHTALLVKLDPADPRFQFSFAYCLHHLGDHEAAGRHYAQSLLYDATNAVCLLRAGECLLATGGLAEAREAFEATVKLSYTKVDYADVRQLAQQYLDDLAQMGA